MAVLLCNSVPVFTLPGFQTPLFVHDVLYWLLLALMLTRARIHRDWLPGLVFVFVAVVGWPFVGIAASLLEGREGYAWASHLYRRWGFFVFFLAGATGIVRSLRLQQFLDACVVVWLLMSAVGLLQYFGVVNVDFQSLNVVDGSRSIVESVLAQRGFLGLNRGAVGVWGSVFVVYALAQLLYPRRQSVASTLLFAASAASGSVAVLFSGSRTGLVALLVGITVVVLGGVRRIVVRTSRLVLIGFVLTLFTVPLLRPAAQTLSQRLQGLDNAVSLQSASARINVQALTIGFVLRDVRTASIGRGPGSDEFMRVIGGGINHPHSEYVQILWEAGFVGLLLYLVLLGWWFRLSFRVDSTQQPSLSRGLRGMLAAGAVSGLAVGFLMVTSDRLSSFGMLMMYIMGLMWNLSHVHALFPRSMPAGSRGLGAPRPTVSLKLGSGLAER